MDPIAGQGFAQFAIALILVLGGLLAVGLGLSRRTMAKEEERSAVLWTLVVLAGPVMIGYGVLVIVDLNTP